MSAQILDFTPSPSGIGLPPQNIEAEEAVLGGILIDPDALLRVLLILKPDSFYINAHRDIFAAAVALHQASIPVDLQTVTNWLNDHNRLDCVGGRTKMAQLVDRTVSAVNIDYLAQIVADKAVSRRMISVANEVNQLGYDQSEALDQRLDAAEQKIFALRQQKQARNRPEAIADISIGLFQQMEQLSVTGEIPAIASGFYDLDNLLSGGLYPEDLIIVGARPSIGKSLLACSIAYQIADIHQAPTLIFSLEMSKESIVRRYLSSLTQIESDKLRLGTLSPIEWERVAQAINELTHVPVLIDDTSCPSIQEIKSKVRSIISQHGNLKLVVIDYLQLLVDGGDNRLAQKLGEVTRQLKLLARECKVPVMLLSQLNRGVEDRNNKRPLMSDLRECLTRDCYLTDAHTANQISIADVKPGQRVLAVSKQQRLVSATVSDVWFKGNRQVYRLTTESGQSIKGTANHPILTKRGYVALLQLKSDDLVATYTAFESGEFRTSNKVEAARLEGELTGRSSIYTSTISTFNDLLWSQVRWLESAGTEETWDIRVPQTGNFLANNIVTHNSGRLEEDADVILFPYRDEYYNPATPDLGVMEISCAKHRNGPTGTVKLLFDGTFSRLRNLAVKRD